MYYRSIGTHAYTTKQQAVVKNIYAPYQFLLLMVIGMAAEIRGQTRFANLRAIKGKSLV